jgi:hypothetical protein
MPNPHTAAEAEHDRMARNRASASRPIMRHVEPASPLARPAFGELVLRAAIETATSVRDAKRNAYHAAPRSSRRAAARDFRQATAVLTAAQRHLADYLRETPHHRDLEAHAEIEKVARTDSWRRRTKLDSMLRADEIDIAQWLAGAQYRADREVGEMGARNGDGGGAGGSGCPTQVALDAIRRLRMARARLNSGCLTVLMDGLADDLPWGEIAKSMGSVGAWSALTERPADDADGVWREATRLMRGLTAEALNRLTGAKNST